MISQKTPKNSRFMVAGISSPVTILLHSLELFYWPDCEIKEDEPGNLFVTEHLTRLAWPAPEDWSSECSSVQSRAVAESWAGMRFAAHERVKQRGRHSRDGPN